MDLVQPCVHSSAPASPDLGENPSPHCLCTSGVWGAGNARCSHGRKVCEWLWGPRGRVIHREEGREDREARLSAERLVRKWKALHFSFKKKINK